MSFLSILGGLILLMLGICGATICGEQCGRANRPVQASASAAPATWQEVFPERLGNWARQGALSQEASGWMSCTYARGAEVCRLTVIVSNSRFTIRAFGKDLPDANPPEGWRFFRDVGQGEFLAGYGEGWILEQGLWLAQGRGVKVSMSGATAQAGLELIGAIPRIRLEEALQR